VGHVGLDKVASGKRSAQAELTGQDGGRDDAGQLASVLTRGGGVRTTDTEHLKHGGLRLENGTATNGADLNRGHGDGNLEITIAAVVIC
jgi:hypothetical protein